MKHQPRAVWHRHGARVAPLRSPIPRDGKSIVTEPAGGPKAINPKGQPAKVESNQRACPASAVSVKRNWPSGGHDERRTARSVPVRAYPPGPRKMTPHGVTTNGLPAHRTNPDRRDSDAREFAQTPSAWLSKSSFRRMGNPRIIRLRPRVRVTGCGDVFDRLGEMQNHGLFS